MTSKSEQPKRKPGGQPGNRGNRLASGHPLTSIDKQKRKMRGYPANNEEHELAKKVARLIKKDISIGHILAEHFPAAMSRATYGEGRSKRTLRASDAEWLVIKPLIDQIKANYVEAGRVLKKFE